MPAEDAFHAVAGELPVMQRMIAEGFLGNKVEMGGFYRFRDPADRAMVEAITRMAHALGITVVAEHVESLEVAQQAAALGLDLVQGFAIHVPEPLAVETLTTANASGESPARNPG